ncbi:MAG: (2Fe-2S)-binding protein [Acidobacteriota bacterium]|nr:(2Fe-2S)-binding protein [Acidobacteriota bacterium]
MGFPEFDVEVASVHFEPSGREVRVVHETSLLDSVLQAGLGLGQSCDGIALCGFCRVQVVEGIENLSPMAEEERKILAAQHGGDNERLACRARVSGPVTITTDYW